MDTSTVALLFFMWLVECMHFCYDFLNSLIYGDFMLSLLFYNGLKYLPATLFISSFFLFWLLGFSKAEMIPEPFYGVIGVTSIFLMSHFLKEIKTSMPISIIYYLAASVIFASFMTFTIVNEYPMYVSIPCVGLVFLAMMFVSYTKPMCE